MMKDMVRFDDDYKQLEGSLEEFLYEEDAQESLEDEEDSRDQLIRAHQWNYHIHVHRFFFSIVATITILYPLHARAKDEVFVSSPLEKSCWPHVPNLFISCEA